MRDELVRVANEMLAIVERLYDPARPVGQRMEVLECGEELTEIVKCLLTE